MPPAQEAAETAPVVAAAVAEDEQFIEVWRPGRFEGRERHRGGRNARRDDRKRPSAGGQPAQAETSPADGSVAAQPAAGNGEVAAEAPQQRHGKHRGRGPKRHGRQNRGEQTDNQRPQHQARNTEPRPERRERPERQPDPNSPFAKLAALKEQMAANRKE